MRDTDLIRAAGAVLWRPDGTGQRVAVVHRPRYDDWSLPKGKLDAGETTMAAALREVHEETGFRAVLGRRLGRTSYVVRSPLAKRTGPKTVDYWAAKVVAGEFAANDEVDELRWLTPDRAADLLSHQLDRGVLATFAAAPAPTATVLLVRHAKAGDRSRWSGEDELRPLSAAGRGQAAALRAQLPVFGPTQVHSAEPVRCVQTVQPLADDLGVAVVREPLMGEDAFEHDPDAARERLLDLVEPGGVAVVCSQGGVIPDLVRGLADRSGLEPGPDDDLPSKKASTWVLSLHDRRLTAADHYPPP